MLHRLVDLRVFERIEVDLSGLDIRMSERFGDQRNIHALAFEYRRIGVASYVGGEVGRDTHFFCNLPQMSIHLMTHFVYAIFLLLRRQMNSRV